MNFSYQDALAYYGISGAHPGSLSLTKRILQQEIVFPNMRILDAGCGTGQTSSYIAKTYPSKVYAIDSHAEMIQRSKHRFSKERLPISLYHASMENMPFRSSTFDLVLAESSTAFTNIPRTVSEYYRVLKENGVLITIDMTAEPNLSPDARHKIKQFYGVNAVLTEKEWIHTFKRAGFHTVKTLKAATIFDELATPHHSEANPEGSNKSAPSHPAADLMLTMHHKLSMQYGSSLGYRVFRITK
ncbi:class I SAM-dependent methyltransferase [Peribacillus deserti]|uniref:Class I SAM-dependent methyltransferase n=1 Tax=Peribacillus deserti TaxID=673318 RepID=A0A2N5MB04_9BACI|nr:class I SAM-dependent methyltransferase [Peribacillus deserti]PLT31539.1 class I SAM-dependent methyltransferase [Peribacillus deserti]